MLPRFRLHIYARPPQVEFGPEREIAGRRLATLQCMELAGVQLPISFEQAAARLEQFERMHFEYDGSFVWTGVHREETDRAPSAIQDAAGVDRSTLQAAAAEFCWQLDGMLYDYAGQLQRVELKGSCPMPEWSRLLNVFAPSSDLLLVYLLDEQCFVSVETLHQLWVGIDDEC